MLPAIVRSNVASETLLRIPLELLRPHPLNANALSSERFEKLRRNIALSRRYPPLVVREHPTAAGGYQLLDGHQRANVLRSLGHHDALCFLWNCDDPTALLLIATLNGLRGEDEPAKRAELLSELASLLPIEALAQILPEDGRALEATLAQINIDAATVVAELSVAAGSDAADKRRVISFTVSADDDVAIEQAVAGARKDVSPPHSRGHALGVICKYFLENHG